MNNLIRWIYSYNEVLMVIITFVYVIATIIICYFNYRSTKASRDQILASQKQQKQNAGLQLYSMRREIINKIGKHQFDEVFWDVPLLFNDQLFSEFAIIGQDNNKLNALKTNIDLFEKELDIFLPKPTMFNIKTQITIAKVQSEYDALESLMKKDLQAISNSTLSNNEVDQYIKNLKQADDLQGKINTETLDLILKLNDFTKKSIQVA